MTQAPPVPDLPPSTRSEERTEVLHGVSVSDPYRWLEDERAPEVEAWMAAQDDHARRHLHALPGREALRERYAELYYLEELGTPIKRGGRTFYGRRHKDREKAIVYWRDERGEERVLLDPNTFSEDNTVSLGVWVPSWDGRKVVFAERPNAADEATLFVLDVDTGQRSAIDVIPGAKYAGPSWAPDSKSFVYEWLPTDPEIPSAELPGYTELRRHVLGEDPAADEVLHARTGDPTVFLGGSLSRDGRWLFVSLQRGWNENDVLFKRVGHDADWRPLVRGRDATYAVLAWEDVFYVFTDEGAPNRRVFKVDPSRPERAAWRELIPEDPAATRDGLVLVGGQLAVSSLVKAASRLDLFDLDGRHLREVALPGLGTASNLVGLEDDDEAYFSFSSFVLPRQVFRADLKTGRTEVWAQLDVPVDPSRYEVRQVFYPSKDGTPVSMFLVCRRDVKLDGDNPVLLYGYGGFGINLTSTFSGFIYPWLEAGGVYAQANLRGGDEYGKAWHDAGKLEHKQNVFDDFAAAARYLVAERWTRPERLAIYGGSNGGLLVGAAMTQHPELYGAVLCAVPLLDMVRYHRTGGGMTWTPEYGNPEEPDAFGWLWAYSPYHRVVDGAKYPKLLMLSADHDDRVDPMHARKFVARVQAASGGGGVAWLRIERHAGHGGADQVAKNIDASVDKVAFLLWALGVHPPHGEEANKSN